MKFAREFRETLEREGFAHEWIKAAIPYGQLKKCIRSVEAELRTFGLDAETLHHLSAASNTLYSPTVQHASGGDSSEHRAGHEEEPSLSFHPRLILYIQLKNEFGMDAALSADTRAYLQQLTSSHDPRKARGISSVSLAVDHRHPADGIQIAHERGADNVRRLEVPLAFGSHFFGLLMSDVLELDALQSNEQSKLGLEIASLGTEVAKAVNPTNGSRVESQRWRDVFEVYLQASIFFSTKELDHGYRNSGIAARQLNWFQNEITRKGLHKAFKSPLSRSSLIRFFRVNAVLLDNLKFQEINRLAVSKILKKFDKRTSLGTKNIVSRQMLPGSFMTENMAKAVCASVSNEIIRVVPQLDDYLCPVCFSISYKPIRLSCGHVFCIRCMVEMQRVDAKHCPLCRNDAVTAADSANLDIPLMNFLRQHFPVETKAKQRENNVAAGVDRYGQEYANAKCTIM